jgi:hypothetical protein
MESDAGVAHRLEARAQIVYALATAQAAAKRLADDVAALGGEVAKAKYQIEAAVAALLVIEGEEIAASCLHHEEVARDLRHKLGGLARLWIGRGNADRRPSALRLGVKAMRLLDSLPLNDLDQQYPASRDPSAATLTRWQFAASRLLLDPEAKVEVE